MFCVIELQRWVYNKCLPYHTIYPSNRQSLVLTSLFWISQLNVVNDLERCHSHLMNIISQTSAQMYFILYEYVNKSISKKQLLKPKQWFNELNKWIWFFPDTAAEDANFSNDLFHKKLPYLFFFLLIFTEHTYT